MSRRAVLTEALAATPRDLARTLRRVDDAQAQRRAETDGRSIVDIIAHLRDEEALHLARWQRAVAHDDGGQASVHPLMPDTGQHSLHDLVAEWTERRTDTLAFLSGLEQQAWGIVLDRGETSVRLRDDVQALVTHDNEHLNQILELRDLIAR